MKIAWNQQCISRFYQNRLMFWRLKYRSLGDQGFTLIELLVVMLLGGILTSSLLWLVVQLVSSDQRESVRTETDREVQLSLDYMITDLREAVYIYNGDCNTPTGSPTGSPFCPSYGAFIPSSLNDTDSIPVLAFWKTHPLDLTALQTDVDALTGDLCSNYSATVSTAIQIAESECDDVRLQRNSYELVVYVHETDSGDTWEGESRIRRYSLDKYDGNPRMTSDLATTLRWTNGYVDPAQINNNFFGWPFDSDGNNCQSSPVTCDNARGVNLNAVTTGTAPGSAGPVLMDFVAHPRRKYEVDGSSALVTTNTNDPDITGTTLCPGGYSHVPRDASDNDDNIRNDRLLSRNFYVCVRNVVTSGDFQDAIIYLRGNPLNRSGISQTIVRPLTQTQVTMRGIIDRNP